MKYYCEICDRDVDDNGPYELTNSDYCCQDCMEESIARAERLCEEVEDENPQRTNNKPRGRH